MIGEIYQAASYIRERLYINIDELENYDHIKLEDLKPDLTCSESKNHYYYIDDTSDLLFKYKIKVKIIEEFGGSEGAGEHMHTVFQVEDQSGKYYVKVDGHYNSYDGNNYYKNCAYQVEPFKKVITDWKKVK